MKTSTVLVFPCGSEIGLEIHRSLKYSQHVRLIGASSTPSNHGRYLYKNYKERLPFVDQPGFIDELNDLVDKNGVDFVMPAHDSVVLKLAEERTNLHCEVIGSPVATCRTCRSKKATYGFFDDKLRVPRTYSGHETDLPFPLFLKPDVGQGSKGTRLARGIEEVRFHVERDPTLLILEYLPGNEYTVDCFTDRRGELRFTGPRSRLRTCNGISVDTKPVKAVEFNAFAHIINANLVLRGAWFFQVKRARSGELALLEVAPRIAGSMGLYRGLGVNFALLSLYDKLGLDVEILHNSYGIRMDRALESRFRLDLSFRHVYIDLDDTIVVNDLVNLASISFIYQCRNRGIAVHLLTRHRGDLQTTLRHYHLDGLFDTVTLVPSTAEKCQYIKEENAIFIDDSFAERKAVYTSCNIPTFGTEAIESLTDWRMY